MPCSLLPPWFILRDAVGGDHPGQKLCVLHVHVPLSPYDTYQCGETLPFCSFADHLDFVSQLCRLGGQSPYLSGQFWFILCSDMLPHRTLTWSISTRPQRGMKWKYSMSRKSSASLQERRHSLQNCCPP